MKFLIILLLSTVLNASCTQQETEASNTFFLQASQAKTLDLQIPLLQKSLKACFSYEVEASLLMLQAQQSSDANKIKLYNKALESLSNIQNNDMLVLKEQNRINQLLAKLYASTDKELSDIYKQKTIDPTTAQTPKNLDYWFYILISILAIWVILEFFKRA